MKSNPNTQSNQNYLFIKREIKSLILNVKNCILINKNYGNPVFLAAILQKKSKEVKVKSSTYYTIQGMVLERPETGKLVREGGGVGVPFPTTYASNNFVYKK